MILEMNFIY